MLEAAGIENLTPFTMQADIMNDADPAPQAVAVQEALLRRKAGRRLRLQPAGDRLDHRKVPHLRRRQRRAGGRRLRDDADRLHLPALDGRRAEGARRSGRQRASRPKSCRWSRRRRARRCCRSRGSACGSPGARSSTDVDFAIAPGEFTGLIGSNGAGKTTLFRAILGLQAPSEGRILVGGRPRSRRNRLIGYVPQKFLLDPDLPLRGRDLVGLGLDAHRLGFTLNRRRRARAVEEMLAAVDAESFADTRVGRLSGGEQQRILIAHALISGAAAAAADEPLANLDLRSAQEVVALLARIAASAASRS